MIGILTYINRMILVMLAALPVWAVLRCIFLKRQRQGFHWKHELLMAAFVVWCVSLAGQTILPAGGEFISWGRAFSQQLTFRINLVPFHTIRQYIACGNIALLLVNLIGNIVVFVPLGLFPPLLWAHWRTWRGALLPALCSLCVEITQVFTGRSVDVDDLLLNAFGGFLGWLAAMGLLHLRIKRHAGGLYTGKKK